MATNVKRKKKAEVMSDDGSMTLTGHLKELRNRLIICAAVCSGRDRLPGNFG